MTQENGQNRKTEDPKGTKASRSPSYPGISLEEALARARVLYGKEKEYAAPIDTILDHWEYKPKSGPGLVCLAALKKFGLLTDEGSGSDRQGKLTGFALDIILDDREDGKEREKRIREAGLLPEIHKQLLEKYNGELPSDQTLRYHLMRNKGFTENGAIEFIREFKQTIKFAKLDEYDNISRYNSDKNNSYIGDVAQPLQVDNLAEDNEKIVNPQVSPPLNKLCKD